MNTTVNLKNWAALEAKDFPETPFYLYDLEVLKKVWESFAAQSQRIKDYRVYFAMKSNNNAKVLDFFKSMKCGIDVVSKYEMFEALKLGFKPEDIVFSGVGKTTQELTDAANKGIKLINCESEDEFLRLKKVAKSLKKKVAIGFRVNPDVDAITHPYIATGLKNHKFGIDFETAFRLYREAHKEKEIFSIESVSVHIGSQIQNVGSFREAFFKVKTFMEALDQQGIQISTFDLGGGLGLRYEDPETLADFKNYFDVIENLQKSFKHPVHLASELGRSLVAQCGTLISRVIGQKESGEKSILIVDASMSELIRPALYQARHPICVGENSNLKNSKNKIFEVVGPVCESSDVFGSDYELPEKLSEGDLLGFQMAGAYGKVMASQYNLRPLPQEYYLDFDKKIKRT